MPASARQRSTTAGDAVTRTPSASNTSALPDRLDTERLPCLATRTPHAATTSAAHDEMLKVPDAIAAGAAGIEHVVVAARHLHGVRAHRPREADDLGRPLAFHRQADEQRRQCAPARRALPSPRPSRPRLRRAVRSSWRVSFSISARKHDRRPAAAFDEIAQDAAAFAGQDRLGMKLDAVHRPASGAAGP